MKIAILTQPLIWNYGGILQNYALQQVLIKMGHEPETIDIHQKMSPFRIFAANILFKYLHIGNKRLTINEYHYKYQNTRGFVRRYIHLTKPYKFVNKSVLKEKFDAYVVGSDQVWRPLYNGRIEDMFFEFLGRDNNFRKIAYAVSFGTSKWEYSKQQEYNCKCLVQDFVGVSVRENSGIDLCKRYFGINAKLVLDPTLLLSMQDYEKLLTQEIASDSNLLTVYILDPSDRKTNLINSFALKYGYKIHNIGKHRFDDPQDVVPSIESWLNGFRNARCVVTDSFHGTVFSIIFRKNFFTFTNHNRGNDRIYSLLDSLNIKSHIIEENVSSLIDNNDLNFSEINALLSKMQTMSYEFLRNSLS